MHTKQRASSAVETQAHTGEPTAALENTMYFCLFVFIMLGIESKALSMAGRCSSTELHPFYESKAKIRRIKISSFPEKKPMWSPLMDMDEKYNSICDGPTSRQGAGV